MNQNQPNPKSGTYFIVVLLSFLSLNTFAQKAPVKYGNVNLEDLKMTVCEIDSSAPAVVLCSYGSFDADNFLFTHHYRVKILKKEGYDLATRKFPTSNKYNVKGKTYNLVDGEIVTDKLKSGSVFSEKVTGNYYLVNVAMPNVKEGSVIDLVITYDGFPFLWYFQENIPVRWSELRIETLKGLSYQKNFFGYERLSINESGRWVAENVPAFKPEPFMDSRENYITKFEFDITSLYIPGYYYNDIASDWNEVSETLLDSHYFGSVLKTGYEINKAAKEFKDSDLTDIEKLKAALDYVHEIEFDGSDRCFSTEESFSYNLREKTGNSADLNLMLIKLLDKMDFTVYPVVLSTKDNGLLSPVNPSLRKLNYVLAYVKLDTNYVLVDATDDLLPYYMLPEKCLNWHGRLVHEDMSQWVDLKPTKKDEELVYYDVKLEEDLTLSGQISYRRNGYAAYDFRKKYNTFSTRDDYIESLTEKYHGLSVLNSDIKYLDSIYYPINDSYDVTIEDKVFNMDSTLYLQLSLFEQMEENPFKADERKYPVDFSVPVTRTAIVNITLPDNYKVVELPKPAKVVLPNNNASFIFSARQLGNTITLNHKLVIDKTMFVLDEYEYLKLFYNEIIKKEAEPVVIEIANNDL